VNVFALNKTAADFVSFSKGIFNAKPPIHYFLKIKKAYFVKNSDITKNTLGLELKITGIYVNN